MIRSITTAFVFSLLITNLANAQSPEGALYDADGRRIGPIVAYLTAPAYYPYTEGPKVYVQINDSVALITLSPTLTAQGFWDPTRLVPGNDTVYFEGLDCTGAAYIPESPWTGARPSATIGNGKGGGFLYLGAYEASALRTLASIRSGGAPCRPLEGIEMNVQTIRASEIINLRAMFKPPYRLR